MTQRLVILALLSILAASCSRGEAAPPSFDGSCAARIHSWADWQRAEHLQSFACLDAPTEGATSTSPTELRGWAGYPAHPEVAIQMQVADELGHRMLETAHRTIEGYGGSFRLVPFREVARLPAVMPRLGQTNLHEYRDE